MGCLFAGVASAAPAPVRSSGDGDLANRVATLERMSQARNDSRIELQQQVQSLTSDVATLRGQLEEQQHQLQQMVNRQRDLYQEIDQLQQQLQNGNNVAGTSAANANAGSDDAATDTTDISSASPTEDEHDAYERAVNLVLKDRRYDQASKAFAEFIKQYPDSSYASNAHYWLAQLQYTQGQLDDAKSSFQTVVDKFPKSPKRAESIFKLGLIAQQQGDTDKATALFKRVLKEYPGTSSARLAQGQLKK